MQTTDTLQYPVYTYTNQIRAKQSFPMESITTTKEEYLNILNELLELVPLLVKQIWYWLMGNNENLTSSTSENCSQE